MKIIAKKQADGTIRFDAQASTKEIEKAYFQATVDFAMSMGLTAERGKTVEQTVEEKLGIKNLDSIVEPKVIEHLVPYAIDKKGVLPAFPPVAEAHGQLRRGKEFSFSFTLTPKPEYELKSYEPVEIQAKRFAVPEEAIEAEFDKMAEMYTTYTKRESDGPVAAGDACSITMEATKDGEKIGGLCMDGRTYVAGQGYMPKGFDDQIIGMKVGETKSFSFEGPGYDENFNEIVETVECTVTINEMQEPVKPAFDDEWVKLYMPMYKSADELRGDITKRVEAQYRDQYDAEISNMIAAQLVSRFEGKIADGVYEAMQRQLMSNLQQDLASQGIKFEDYVEKMGGESQWQMIMMLQTRDTLVRGYCLDAVFRHFKLVIGDEDLKRACRTINPEHPDYIRSQMEETGKGFALRETAERMKALDYLQKNAIINYVD